jgi:hypothetical protein
MGYVYILRNDRFSTLVKIGRTSKAVSERVAQLNGTGTPGITTELYQCRVLDEIVLEKLVHLALGQHRDTANKEFFKISAVEARKVIRSVASKNGIQVIEENSANQLNDEDMENCWVAALQEIQITSEIKKAKLVDIYALEVAIRNIESASFLIKAFRRGELIKSKDNLTKAHEEILDITKRIEYLELQVNPRKEISARSRGSHQDI